jgi:hypothetical protein
MVGQISICKKSSRHHISDDKKEGQIAGHGVLFGLASSGEERLQ